MKTEPRKERDMSTAMPTSPARPSQTVALSILCPKHWYDVDACKSSPPSASRQARPAIACSHSPDGLHEMLQVWAAACQPGTVSSILPQHLPKKLDDTNISMQDEEALFQAVMHECILSTEMHTSSLCCWAAK